MKFIIFSPSYDENSGGIIVLHKLCHNLNLLGYDAYIFPLFDNKLYLTSFKYRLKKFILNKVLKRKFILNNSLNTTLFKGIVSEQDIVIYPEIVFGNPLKAKNVIRWLLHKPGFHSGDIFYNKGELYYKFSNGLVDDFNFYGSKLSDNIFNIVHIPYDIYNLEGVSKNRELVAYSIRKSKRDKYDKHPENAICIDGLSHNEIASIFKKAKIFISYDPYTGYSSFAALCGCLSIVVPEDGVTIEEWYPDEEKRYGIAYGFSDSQLESATKTQNLKIEYYKNIDNNGLTATKLFVEESKDFFKLN